MVLSGPLFGKTGTVRCSHRQQAVSQKKSALCLVSFLVIITKTVQLMENILIRVFRIEVLVVLMLN